MERIPSGIDETKWGPPFPVHKKINGKVRIKISGITLFQIKGYVWLS